MSKLRVTCAAGVHSLEIRDFLEAEDYDKSQGYLISRPIGAGAFEKLFDERIDVAGTEKPNEPVPAVGP